MKKDSLKDRKLEFEVRELRDALVVGSLAAKILGFNLSEGLIIHYMDQEEIYNVSEAVAEICYLVSKNEIILDEYDDKGNKPDNT